MNKIVTVKVHVPYIRWVSPSKVLIGNNWYDAVRCDKRKLPVVPPYVMTEGMVELPPYIARELIDV